jgi:hypothetical protein
MISLLNGIIMQKLSDKNESDLKEKHNQFESELQIQRCLLDLSKKSKV